MKFLLIALWAVCTCAKAQVNQRGITLAEYSKVKTVILKNVEKKTYIRDQGFIFDRPEEKPYSFNLNDGIERKIYLYHIMDGASAVSIGSFAVFAMQGRQINMAIPNKLAPNDVWVQYLNDLKAGNKTADGLAVCVAFLLAQGKTEIKKDSTTEDTNDVCFPAETFINLTDGSEKAIAKVKVGDTVTGIREGKVVRVDFHEGNFQLNRILVRPNGQAWVSTHLKGGLIALEATPNHPILTLTGKQPVGQLKKGDWLFVRDAVSGRYLTAEIAEIEVNARTVSQVFNLKTEGGTYEAESIVVLDKN
ncbi:Hint domain-containing protein [Runella sp.]|uniref:Hint domain-containing protein n=1 Tax=Runella sp. TaxID=1960881 RepID=UPI003019B02E